MDRKRVEGLPPWMLTPKEENEVFLNWRDNAWKACDQFVQDFVKCEHMAGYGVWFKCRKQSAKMKECIKSRQKQEYVDEERDKFIKKKMELLKQQREGQRGDEAQ
ncbi:uncharacterized protein OGAPODRAFT_9870 [Ogataea polymorpha]|uniref:uncharacterized protein n=1 Tax=Ogataea polymorpha TaxID=460523 RepID=UPI0007F4D5DA|nr:uncharacterized protein OGAPODRAFT_9870 [Ogataea polymorpha]OBA14335.1 hypothetical protein OGAPODRAFT_9870 [Ogataea polymorpha]